FLTVVANRVFRSDFNRGDLPLPRIRWAIFAGRNVVAPTIGIIDRESAFLCRVDLPPARNLHLRLRQRGGNGPLTLRRILIEIHCFAWRMNDENTTLSRFFDGLVH